MNTTPVCDACNHVIDFGPYLTKVWATIDKEEFYHPRCYVLTHPGIIENNDPLPAGLKTTSLGLLIRSLGENHPRLLDMLNDKVESVVGIENKGYFTVADSYLYYCTLDSVQRMERGTMVKLRL